VISELQPTLRMRVTQSKTNDKAMAQRLDFGGSGRTASLLLGLLFLAQLLAGLHQNQEQHTLCAEHQQVEHGELSHADGVEGHADETETVAIAQLQSTTSEPAESHEECALEPFLREVARGAEVAQLAAPFHALAIRALPVVNELGFRQVSLLRLAPKQSPPA
jgi:hypothetical protein